LFNQSHHLRPLLVVRARSECSQRGETVLVNHRGGGPRGATCSGGHAAPLVPCPAYPQSLALPIRKVAPSSSRAT
jgi:hypothetical protein